MKKSSQNRLDREQRSHNSHTKGSGSLGIFGDLRGQELSPGNQRKNAANAGNPEVLEIADRLHSAAIHLLRRVRKEDVSTGEGPARLSALSVLVFGGPTTLGELAAAEQVKPPTMSRIVAGLSKNRLIEIATDADDARRMRIRATAKGTQLLQTARQNRIASLVEQLQTLAPEDLAKLRDAIQILNRLF